MNDTLENFKIQVIVCYEYRSPPAKRVAKELVAILGGKIYEWPPFVREDEPICRVRIDFHVMIGESFQAISSRYVELRKFDQLKEKEQYIFVLKESLLDGLLEFLRSKFEKKLGWTDES